MDGWIDRYIHMYIFMLLFTIANLPIKTTRKKKTKTVLDSFGSSPNIDILSHQSILNADLSH